MTLAEQPGAAATPADPARTALVTAVAPADASKPVRERTGGRLTRLHSTDPEAFAKPQGREEDWRFTPLRRLRGLLDGPGADAKLDVAVSAPNDAGVTVEQVDSTDPRIGSVLTPADRISAFTRARADGALVVTVAAEAAVAEPIVVRVGGEGGLAYHQVVVDVRPFASATVVLDHVGTATVAGNVELRVGDSASLTFISLQDWEAGAVHVAAHAVSVGRDARFQSFTITLGGDLVRLSPTVTYAGPGGEADLYGMFFTDAGQHQEHRLLVEHGERSCRSRVTYKGALHGDGAHSVWIGDVVIGPDAIGTDTYESNRNLLLTDGARADSVPNLEILTGEVVGAGHASATGRFDDEALFYLMARGIPADEARRLVVRGFFAEIVDRITVPDLADRIMGAVDAELDAAEGARVGAEA
ncbi:MAG: Fe-S cluster assembly protein SufD [Frankia sp.]